MPNATINAMTVDTPIIEHATAPLKSSLFAFFPNSQLITAPRSGAKIIRLKKLFSVIFVKVQKLWLKNLFLFLLFFIGCFFSFNSSTRRLKTVPNIFYFYKWKSQVIGKPFFEASPTESILQLIALHSEVEVSSPTFFQVPSSFIASPVF